MEKPRFRDIQDALYRLIQIQFMLTKEYEENEGEVTDSTELKEEMKSTILYMLENGGVDELARLLNSVKGDIEQYKDEEKYIKRLQARSESFQEDVLECINISLEFLGEEKMKSKLGYSFTQHIATSTKPDTKLIKELFYKDVEKAIRDAHVCPEHITFTLSASSSLLKDGEDMPDYFTTTTRARAKYLKPRKAKKEEQEELTTDEF